MSQEQNLSGMEVGGRAWRVIAVFLQILRTVRSTSTTRLVCKMIVIFVEQNVSFVQMLGITRNGDWV